MINFARTTTIIRIGHKVRRPYTKFKLSFLLKTECSIVTIAKLRSIYYPKNSFVSLRRNVGHGCFVPG